MGKNKKRDSIWGGWEGLKIIWDLISLKQKGKCMFEKDNIQMNDLVIIKEDNIVIFSWPLGRIAGLFPGNDGKIRVESVKTQRGIFKTPITKICLLHIKKMFILSFLCFVRK